MAVNNVKKYEGIKNLLKLAGNLSNGLQILVIFFVILCITHIILGVCDSHLLDFADPLIKSLKDFTTMLFGTSIKHSQDGIDGREVLFILFSIVLSYFLSQLKLIFDSYIKAAERKIVEEKQKAENAVNRELQRELEREALAQTSFVFAIQFKIRWLTKESLGVLPPTPEELSKVKMEALGKFYENIKTFPGLKFSKDDDVLILSGSNINDVDKTISKVWELINSLKAQYKLNKYGIRVKLVIDSHKPSEPFSAIYKKLTPLFGLNAYNELLCYGNFKHRYELIKDAEYYISVKGRYDIVGASEDTIWTLIKKD